MDVETITRPAGDDTSVSIGAGTTAACAVMLRRAFPGLPQDGVEHFAALGTLITARTGEILCSSLFTPAGLMVVADGRLVIEQNEHAIAEFQAGHYFGEGVLVRDDTPQVTIRAVETTQVYLFPRAQARAFMERFPAFGTALFRHLLVENMKRLGNTNRLFAENRSLALDLENTLQQLAREIEEREQSEAKIRFLATHDSLTGMLNRVTLRERMEYAIRQSRRTDRPFAVLMLDLDGFKEVNDLNGHATGDQVLTEVAKRIMHTVRDTDLVARQGGDEFAIIVDLAHLPITTPPYPHVASCAERLIDAVCAPMPIDGLSLAVGVSIGVALFPSDGEDTEDLLRNADLAMYRAKREGGRQCQPFTPSLGRQVARATTLKAELRRAITGGDLSLAFQPKVDLMNGRITGVEALLRWSHPELGEIQPAEFIPLAEQTGLVLDIGEWVVDRACEAIREWRQWPAPPPRVAMNVSPVHFRRKSVAGLVLGAIERYGIDPELFGIEITEGVLVHDPDMVERSLRRLRGEGVSVAVDDFGTGYASMSYLKRLSASEVKIDRAFVKSVGDSPEDTAIVAAMVSLSHSLGMTVVAEGAETIGQLRLLRKLRCDAVQGFLLCPPLPMVQLRDFMERCVVKEVRTVVPAISEIGLSRVEV